MAFIAALISNESSLVTLLALVGRKSSPIVIILQCFDDFSCVDRGMCVGNVR